MLGLQPVGTSALGAPFGVELHQASASASAFGTLDGAGVGMLTGSVGMTASAGLTLAGARVCEGATAVFSSGMMSANGKKCSSSDGYLISVTRLEATARSSRGWTKLAPREGAWSALV